MSFLMNQGFPEYLKDFPFSDNPLDTQEPAQEHRHQFSYSFSSLYNTQDHDPWNPDVPYIRSPEKPDRSEFMSSFLSESSPRAKDPAYQPSEEVPLNQSISSACGLHPTHHAEVNETTTPPATKVPAGTDARISQELEVLPISEELGPGDAVAVVEPSSPDSPRSGSEVTSDDATKQSTPFAELPEPSASPMARTHTVGETSLKRKREEIAHHDSAEPESLNAIAEESSDTPVFKRPNLGNAPSTSEPITPRVSTSPHSEVTTGSVRTTPDPELSVASSSVLTDPVLENPSTTPPVDDDAPAATTIADALTAPSPESPATPKIVPAAHESEVQPNASSSAVNHITPATPLLEAPSLPSVAPPAHLPYTTVFVPKAADWWYGPVTNEVASTSIGLRSIRERMGAINASAALKRKITWKPNAPSQGIGSHILKYHTSQKSEKKVCFGKGCMTHVPSGEEAFCGKLHCKREYDLARADWLAAGN
ncbi:hypothetical protein DFP72DRAFT_857680 [Ephemerocybe angulata]|uniref:Uncharacterized protein n=1 Tax=Ephemerocybe angulata TaxID=980116 RepID=A0A8H6HC92_9AGAR|nr:hypothetical protein DFP72DRAFT_857680 [Tulosesus angulatus]